MKISLRNFNGFFQVEYHTRFVRLLWMLSILLSLSIINFGVWAIVVDFFDLPQSLEPQVFEMALIIFLTLALPALGLIIGSAKVRQKPGFYLKGIRVTDAGLEVGTLTADLPSVGIRNIYEKSNFDNIVEGNWTPEKTIDNEEIDILIVLIAECEPIRHIFFERFVISSGEEILYQLIGKNSNEIVWNDLVALSNGSFKLIENSRGTLPNYPLMSLRLVADIISICRPFGPPSCSVKIVSSSSTIVGKVLTTLMLAGTIIPPRESHFRDKSPSENFSDKNFVKSLAKFLKERGWVFQN